MKKIAENSGKLKAEILGMCGACDNTVFSVHRLSANNIHHLRSYFQCRFVQNNLKSKTNIEYTKLSKDKDNNQI